MSLNLHVLYETKDGVLISNFDLLQTPTKTTFSILGDPDKPEERHWNRYGIEPYLDRYKSWLSDRPRSWEHIASLEEWLRRMQKVDVEGQVNWYAL
jgi:hypothetical protein